MRAALTAPERVKALVLLDTQSGKEDEAALEGYRGMREMWLTARSGGRARRTDCGPHHR